ncbi:MAG: toxin-antitoxin system, antitoxin component, Xre family protein [Oscillospiraceae bacterium]|nr:toxin-antitoxin system, antitoxin component, Xre family protein [Oscillospiraceae bacterium]
MTDTKALRETIESSGMKYKHIAASVGLTPYGLQKKIDNDSEFKGSEIAKLCQLLGLSIYDKERIFFSH